MFANPMSISDVQPSPLLSSAQALSRTCRPDSKENLFPKQHTLGGDRLMKLLKRGHDSGKMHSILNLYDKLT